MTAPGRARNLVPATLHDCGSKGLPWTRSALSWTLAYDGAEWIQAIEAKGVLAMPSTERLRREASDRFRELGCTRVLLDYRGLEAETLRTLDIYNLPKVYLAWGFNRLMRMAVLTANVGQQNLDFFETVCQNNGFAARRFSEEAPAREWLTA